MYIIHLTSSKRINTNFLENTPGDTFAWWLLLPRGKKVVGSIPGPCRYWFCPGSPAQSKNVHVRWNSKLPLVVYMSVDGYLSLCRPAMNWALVSGCHPAVTTIQLEETPVDPQWPWEKEEAGIKKRIDGKYHQSCQDVVLHTTSKVFLCRIPWPSLWCMCSQKYISFLFFLSLFPFLLF